MTRSLASRWIAWTVLAALVLVAPAPARAQLALSLEEAQAIARRQRSEVAAAALDVRLAGFERLRAGLRRVRVHVSGRWSEQVEQRYVNAPPELCTSIDNLCRPLGRARVVDLSAHLEVPVFTGFGLEAEWSRAGQLERAARAQQRAQ